MHPIVYYIIILIVVGGAGMAIANKGAAKLVRKQRWLKYFMYILITGIVILGIFFNFFNWVSYVIVVVSFIEILKVNFSGSPKPVLQLVISFLVLAIVSTGFIFFGKTIIHNKVSKQ